MIEDKDTNFLYLSGDSEEKKRYSVFYSQFEAILRQEKIEFDFLTHTKDIWAVDFMPIQVEQDYFVQFIYDPDYLDTPELKATISNPNVICPTINVNPIKSVLKVDGGNIIKGKRKAIICDKIFRDNNSFTKIEVERKLREELKIDEIIFIPTHKEDKIGHADGNIRFIDDDNVIINDMSKEYKYFAKDFHSTLKRLRLNYEIIPFAPTNDDEWGAKGIYINYLQMRDIIFVPQFGLREDEIALKRLAEIFTGIRIIPVACNSLANDGGVLNCISWNVSI